ncbi:Heme exporter protein CcmD [Bartonella clarridgeiae 73]|uniref:Heme exporter protein CcmD n=1 Tax=Bartonella clarridgeiae (strain CCUG 45776 / CIP 104772 / 73) TaxID=696125 RepID=E6YG18_BARC7|nr:heme exporter protein CcmD [Bartonella clarridgeiae]CBI75806.1 Heme exporter protein CcmD [Bartonella clarridgeiae 73]
MLQLNDTQNEAFGNFVQRIDFFLGTLHHEQIVALSYMLSASVLFCFIGYILRKSVRQKKILKQLQTKDTIWKKQYNENHSSQT